MKRMISGLMVVATLALGGAAFAQDEETQTRFYDFNDMLIDGEFQRPQGMFATERGEASFDTLLNLRRSFIEEIEEAAHEDVLQ